MKKTNQDNEEKKSGPEMFKCEILPTKYTYIWTDTCIQLSYTPNIFCWHRNSNNKILRLVVSINKKFLRFDVESKFTIIIFRQKSYQKNLKCYMATRVCPEKCVQIRILPIFVENYLDMGHKSHNTLWNFFWAIFSTTFFSQNFKK